MSAENEMPNTPTPANEPVDKTVRTFRDRAAAEAAVELLKKAGIAAHLLDLNNGLPGGGAPKTAPNAVKLLVDAADEAKAASILRNQHKEEEGKMSRMELLLQKRQRDRDRYGRTVAQQGTKRSGGAFTSGVFISIALIGALGAVVAMISSFFGDDEESYGPTKPKDRISNLDLNGDRKIDCRRRLDPYGRPIREEYDQDFDGKFDCLLLYIDGRLKERRQDLDENGLYDDYWYFDRSGKPFYSQIITDGRGGVHKRTYYKEETEFPDYAWPEEQTEDPALLPDGGDCWPFWVLAAPKGDGVFDSLEILNLDGSVKEKKSLGPDAPEGKAPNFPE